MSRPGQATENNQAPSIPANREACVGASSRTATSKAYVSAIWIMSAATTPRLRPCHAGISGAQGAVASVETGLQ